MQAFFTFSISNAELADFKIKDFKSNKHLFIKAYSEFSILTVLLGYTGQGRAGFHGSSNPHLPHW